MQLKIVRIGNSRGIRIPASLLKQCGISEKVSVEIEGNKIILKPASTPRKGWSQAFKRMHEAGDDALLWPENIDNNLLEKWDED